VIVMSDKIVFKSNGRNIFKKSITKKQDLEDAFDDLRRKLF